MCSSDLPFLRLRAAQDGQRPYLTCGGTTYTFAGTQRRCRDLARGLKRRGIGEGSRVLMLLPNCAEFVFTWYACSLLGAAIVPLNTNLKGVLLEAQVLDAQADAMIVDSDLLPALDTLREEVRRELPWAAVVGGTTPALTFDALYAAGDDDPEIPGDFRRVGFISYTSGTTGKPKGVVHVHGGYMVGTYVTSKYVFDLKDDDVYFCVADPGWVTGHSYIVYGPLLNGATILTAEGKPDYPNPGRWWDLIERYGVSIFYTTPTAIRLLMRYGEDWPAKYDLSTLRILGSVGEPINPEAWEWFHRVTGGDKPIMDTWWQTETGSILITPLPTVPLKPGSATRPFLGIEADVVDREGNSLPANAGGFAVIKKPWPSMMRTIYKDPERYKTYWNTIPNCYTAGDVCHKDADGYMWFMGRADDVIKVAGNRLGTAEVESALVSHHAVAEAAVIGKPHKTVGESIKAFIILKQGETDSLALIQSIKDQVMKELGKIGVPSEIDIVQSLPKTRSGKIMRRVLKAKELGQDPGDISTIEE